MGQQFTVQSETGEVVSLDPETIIVQQEADDVMVANGDTNMVGNQQYVIRYLNAADSQMDGGETVEVVHSTETEMELETSHPVEEISTNDDGNVIYEHPEITGGTSVDIEQAGGSVVELEQTCGSRVELEQVDGGAHAIEMAADGESTVEIFHMPEGEVIHTVEMV